jgi:DHA3 family macrolide efflux protein-like MFS transporter
MIGLGMLLSVLAWPVFALVPILVTRHFGGGVVELGWFQSILGLGGLLGGLFLHGLGIAIVGLTPADAFPVAMALWFVVGLTAALVNGLSMAILQAIVPVAVQGRVFSLTWSSLSATALIGLAVAGPIGDTVGAAPCYVLAGLGISAVSLGALSHPVLRQIERPQVMEKATGR